MQHDIKELIDKFLDVFLELAPAVFLGILGGFTRTMAGKAREDKYKLQIALPEIFIAIFSGLLVHWIIKDFSMSEGYKTAAVALAGYSARSIITIINAVFIKTAKKTWGE